MSKLIDWVLGLMGSLILFFGLMGATLIYHPQTPLPDAYNPARPFAADDALTFLTRFKLARSIADPEGCTNTLRDLGAGFASQPDRIASPRCGINNNVRLTDIAGIRLRPVETQCHTAVKTALWIKHSVKPAAQNLLGASVERVNHYSSYSCRQIRSAAGSTGRMSEHATANAIDISGFELSNGSRISLKDHWNAGDARAAFLRAVRDGACDWFKAVLGPDYNALHADHFHFDNGMWMTCR